MPGWNADWTISAVEFANQEISHTSTEESFYQCHEWIEGNTLILQRDTFANFFHNSEDFVNVFLTMAILKWSRVNTQILLLDLYPEGPFW